MTALGIPTNVASSQGANRHQRERCREARGLSILPQPEYGNERTIDTPPHALRRRRRSHCAAHCRDRRGACMGSGSPEGRRQGADLHGGVSHHPDVSRADEAGRRRRLCARVDRPRDGLFPLQARRHRAHPDQARCEVVERRPDRAQGADGLLPPGAHQGAGTEVSGGERRGCRCPACADHARGPRWPRSPRSASRSW